MLTIFLEFREWQLTSEGIEKNQELVDIASTQEDSLQIAEKNLFKYFKKLKMKAAKGTAIENEYALKANNMK